MAVGPLAVPAAYVLLVNPVDSTLVTSGTMLRPALTYLLVQLVDPAPQSQGEPGNRPSGRYPYGVAPGRRANRPRSGYEAPSTPVASPPIQPCKTEA